MLCNTKIQYLLFCKACRYCLLALHCTTDVHCHRTAPGQCLLDLIFIQVHCTNLIFVQSQHHDPMPLQKNILPCRVKIHGCGRGAVKWYHQILCTIRWSLRFIYSLDFFPCHASYAWEVEEFCVEFPSNFAWSVNSKTQQRERKSEYASNNSTWTYRH